MRRFRRWKCLFVSLFILLGYLPCHSPTTVHAVSNVVSGDKEVKTYCSATLDDQFADDRLLVVLNHSTSSKLKTYTEKDFAEVSVKSVHDLTQNTKTKLQTARNVTSKGVALLKDDAEQLVWIQENYNQILSLELQSKGKENVLKAIKLLEAREDVLCVAPDYRISAASTETPNDELYQIHQGVVADKIDLPEAWGISTGSSSVRVGVVDSGVDGTHPDLIGQIDTSLCRDFTNETEQIVSTPNDLFGHGTHVAGIIGASGDNTIGVSGVCWDISIVSLRVLDSNGMGYSSNAIMAVDYANSRNIPILNLSLSWDVSLVQHDYYYDQPMNFAIANYFGLVICAAGNRGINNDEGRVYPANFNYPNMITVANTFVSTTALGSESVFNNPDLDDTIEQTGSNYGTNTVHLAAPGRPILSCFPCDTICDEGLYNIDYHGIHWADGYHYNAGTSMAAPHVTGVAALIKSIRPDLSAQEIKALILNNVDPIDDLENVCITGGRLNAYKAVRAATESKTFMGDVNGDGMADMILSRPYNNQWRQFIVCLGQSGGTFGTPVTTTSARPFSSRELVYTGDFNGDGRTDVLLVSSLNQYYQLFVYLGKTDGKFNEAVCLTSTRESYTLEDPAHYFISDVNGDGKDDFVIEHLTPSTSSAEGYQRNILVYQGKAQSPYLVDAASDALAVKDSVGLRRPAYMGDFNGDGYADMAVSYISSTNKQQFWVYAGNANGTFSAGVSVTTSVVNNYPINYSQIVVADTNNNGTDDIVMLLENQSGTKRLIVFQGSATGSFFQTGSNIVLSDTHAFDHTDPIFAGDVNGDGRSDVIVHWVNNGKRQLLVYAANTNGAYPATGVNYASTNAHDPAVYAGSFFVGDVNGDGRDDFIAKWKSSNNVRFLTYCGTASGSFAAAVRTTPSPAIPYYDAA